MAKRNAVISKLKNRQGQHEYQPPEGPEASVTTEEASPQPQAAAVTPAEEAKPAERRAAKPRAAKPAAASSEPVTAPAEPGPTDGERWPAWMLELPGAELHGSELFLRRGNQLHPFSGPAKMTFGVTLEEQQRFQRYAKVRGRDYVDVFREFVGHILSGESE